LTAFFEQNFKENRPLPSVKRSLLAIDSGVFRRLARTGFVPRQAATAKRSWSTARKVVTVIRNHYKADGNWQAI
jgi:hypothetical protein